MLKEDADIIALQETKCDKNKLPEEVKLNGYHYYFLESKDLFYNLLYIFIYKITNYIYVINR